MPTSHGAWRRFQSADWCTCRSVRHTTKKFRGSAFRDWYRLTPWAVCCLTPIMSGIFKTNDTVALTPPFPAGSPSRGEDVTVYDLSKPTQTCPLIFVLFLCLCLSLWTFQLYFYSTKVTRQLYVFSPCSSSLVSALLVLSTVRLFMKVSLSPDVILCG